MREVSARAEIVTRRTYCRPKEDGSFENWEEVVERVICHQRWLWERALTHNVIPGMMLHEVTEDMQEWVSLSEVQEVELSELRELFLDRKCLPAGRSLWLANTKVAKTREASNFNCSFLEVETVYDIVDILWLLLQGCGVGLSIRQGTLVGFRQVIPEIEVINTTRTAKGGREDNEESFDGHTWTISVGDSAEAWAKSIGKLLAGKYKAEKLVLDLTQIRPAGDRLKGYGWISSGSEPLGRAYTAIAGILNRKAGAILNKMDILDIANHLGTVLSSRRSAEIILMDSEDIEARNFAEAKKECFTPEFKHRQQSNNSLVFKKKPTKEVLTKLFADMVANGGSEPGFINEETALKRAPYFKGLNPCAVT